MALEPEMTARAGTEDDAVRLRQQLYDQREFLPHFVVYDHPNDLPDYFVARLWVSLPEPSASGLILGFHDLDDLRTYLGDVIGLTKLSRMPDDDPKILETWL